MSFLATRVLFFGFVLCSAMSLCDGADPKLDPHLEPLAWMIGDWNPVNASDSLLPSGYVIWKVNPMKIGVAESGKAIAIDYEYKYTMQQLPLPFHTYTPTVHVLLCWDEESGMITATVRVGGVTQFKSRKSKSYSGIRANNLTLYHLEAKDPGSWTAIIPDTDNEFPHAIRRMGEGDLRIRFEQVDYLDAEFSRSPNEGELKALDVDIF
ncbi:hypothetical protein [Novipirellula artificiosorum]|uniref:THAP4-like heme-binding beta-barrel domain-containing protein n=1 Tax=Novipirellula artificiosorum TaxID=2528016 RepID=A0A5C6DTY5_9BACT|nr:hypothetical protein [Novipirellula artificiosorum]TWU39367.1 hypothetical protein Poly41_21910 [Novipirellula artificiosorum]